MPNFDKPPPGASPAPEEQLLGELVGTLAELKARYGTEGEELAWATHRALSRHVMQHEGPETWARFKARLVEISKSSLDNIDAILDEDDRRRMH